MAMGVQDIPGRLRLPVTALCFPASVPLPRISSPPSASVFEVTGSDPILLVFGCRMLGKSFTASDLHSFTCTTEVTTSPLRWVLVGCVNCLAIQKLLKK